MNTTKQNMGDSVSVGYTTNEDSNKCIKNFSQYITKHILQSKRDSEVFKKDIEKICATSYLTEKQKEFKYTLAKARYYNFCIIDFETKRNSPFIKTTSRLQHASNVLFNVRLQHASNILFNAWCNKFDIYDAVELKKFYDLKKDNKFDDLTQRKKEHNELIDEARHLGVNFNTFMKIIDIYKLEKVIDYLEQYTTV